MNAPDATEQRPPSGRFTPLRLVSLIGLTGIVAGLLFVKTPDVPEAAPGPEIAERTDRVATRSEAAGIRFEDITDVSGIDRGSPAAGRRGSAGVAVADFDEDGWPDVYLTNVGSPNALMRNNGDGTFTDIAGIAGVTGTDPGQGYLAAAYGDLTGDGCGDLFLTAAAEGTNLLYVSNCRGQFRDETQQRGLSMPPATGSQYGNQQNGVAIADYNGDGQLDLFVPSWYAPELLATGAGQFAADPPRGPERACEQQLRVRGPWYETSVARATNRSRLFRNDGTGHFVDASESAGLQLQRIMAVTGRFVDVDGDHRLDLLIAGDLCTTRLYRNMDGEHFVDDTEDAGVGFGQSDMGSEVVDIDGDGDPDWFTTNISTLDGSCGTPAEDGSETDCAGNKLYINDGEGSFTEEARQRGLDFGWFGWGAVIADFGNSTELSVAQVNTFRPSVAVQLGVEEGEIERFAAYDGHPMRFWVPSKRGYADASSQVGLDGPDGAQSLVPLDADRDGRIDLLQRDMDGSTHLFHNATDGAGAAVTVRLKDRWSTSNRHGVGAVLTVRPELGMDAVAAAITTDGSFAAQIMPEIHVGLGPGPAPTSLHEVTVRWPGCATLQRETAVEAVGVVTIDRDASHQPNSAACRR